MASIHGQGHQSLDSNYHIVHPQLWKSSSNRGFVAQNASTILVMLGSPRLKPAEAWNLSSDYVHTSSFLQFWLHTHTHTHPESSKYLLFSTYQTGKHLSCQRIDSLLLCIPQYPRNTWSERRSSAWPGWHQWRTPCSPCTLDSSSTMEKH